MADTNSEWYAYGLKKLCEGTFDWTLTTGSTIRAMLMLQAHTFDATNQEAHDFVADVSANRATYNEGSADVTLTLITAAINTTTNLIELDATTNPTFSAVSLGETVVGVVIYKFDTDEASSPLMCYLGFADSVSANDGDIVVQWDSVGLMTLSYSAAT